MALTYDNHYVENQLFGEYFQTELYCCYKTVLNEDILQTLCYQKLFYKYFAKSSP